MILTRDQSAFFARNGFLQISGGLSDTSCEQMVAWTEARFPEGWRSDQPQTWVGSVEDACHVNTLTARRGRLQYRVRDLAAEPTLQSSFGPGSFVESVAASLIGCELAPVLLRGLYPIFPVLGSDNYPAFKRGHNEAHPSQLITVSYLRDVEPGGGGLLVWPGSHRAIYPLMRSKLEYVAGENYDAAFDEWTSKEPVELAGRAGDVFIIHHRLLHAPSVNRAKTIRFAFLCDYRAKGWQALCAEKPGPELWEDWPAMRSLDPHELNAPCDFDLPPQAECSQDAASLEKLGKRGGEQPASTKRKGDASILERLRKPGDRWLVLSDCPTSRNDWKLFPRGSDLYAQKTRVFLDGQSTASASQYDHFVSIRPDRPIREIRVENLPRPAWLRLIHTRLPLADSQIELSVELPQGTSLVRFLPAGQVQVQKIEGSRHALLWLKKRSRAFRNRKGPEDRSPGPCLNV